MPEVKSVTSQRKASATYSPIQQQITANYFGRCVELSPLCGTVGQGLLLNQALDQDHLSSNEVTEKAVVSTALGNASGLVIAILMHYSIRDHYRTGKYNIQLRANEPDLTTQKQMKKGDIFIYLSQGQLTYLIKGAWGKLIQGQVLLDENNKSEDFNALNDLVAILRNNVSAETVLPPHCQDAFLHCTHTRRHTYNGKNSTNPLYRACKTLSVFGARLGSVLSILIGAQDPSKRRLISFIMSDIFCLLFGIFGVCYYVVRDKILKIPYDTKHKYVLTGLEGWSKYAKTALTFGTAVGQGVGGLIVGIAAHNAAATVSSFSIAFWGGVVGVASFILSIIAIPLINWLSAKKKGKGILTSPNKNKYRNNYTRSGLTLGAGLGACIGLGIGHWLFGMIMAATIFSALGAVIGGIVLSVYGYQIHHRMHPLLPGEVDNDQDIENSWDYASRSTASVFGFIGAAIACAINPAAALLLAPIGSMIASAIGWCFGILIMRVARRLPGNTDEKTTKASTLPWTQRITTGANIGSTIGGCIGLVFGYAGFILAGPAAVIFAVSLCGAIGAIMGGIAGALYDKRARTLIWQAINPWSQISESDFPANERKGPAPSPSPSLGIKRSSSARVLSLTAVNIHETPLHPNTTSPKLASSCPRMPSTPSMLGSQNLFPQAKSIEGQQRRHCATASSAYSL